MYLLSSAAAFMRLWKYFFFQLRDSYAFWELNSGSTQLKIPFAWKLKCLIGALCFQGIQVRIANTMVGIQVRIANTVVGNRKSPSWSLQTVSMSLLFMILSKYTWNKESPTVYINLIYRYLDESPSDIYSALENVLQRNQLTSELYVKAIGLLE